LNGSSDVEGRGELALDSQNVDLGQGETLKVAVVASLVAL
jgi:putative Ca2+/H+ antiporter (TMEM165/GDT1 family)